MTPQENVDAIVKQLGDWIIASNRRIAHLARDLDIADQTLNRILGREERSNKYGCSMPHVARIAKHFGYKLELTPLSPDFAGVLPVETTTTQ
jgi:hypothetical protein